MSELEKFKLHYEDVDSYPDVLLRLKLYRLKKAWRRRKKTAG